MEPAVEIIGLSHVYKKHTAIKKLDFRIEERSIHGFVGPNGAGKTTTLKILATLLAPQGGVVKVFGQNLAYSAKLVREKIGYMQDHFSMYRGMTVFEYLDFFGAAYGMSVSERTRVIHDILELTDMSGRRSSLIRGLSRGMQQRVALSRALVHDPQLLLLDEPASGLDPRARIELMDILRVLRDLGKTVFISSHILSELAELCDHVTIIDRGEVKYTGLMSGLTRDNVEEGRKLWRVRGESGGEEATAALEKIPGVLSVKAEVPAPVWILEIDSGVLPSNLLLTQIMATGLQVSQFEENRRHLNQAFMDLTDPGVRT